MIPPSPAVVKLISKGLKRGDADGEQARLGLLISLCKLPAHCVLQSPCLQRREPSALFRSTVLQVSLTQILFFDRRSSAVHDEMRHYSLFVALVAVVYLAQEYFLERSVLMPFADAYILAANEETPLSVLVDTLWWKNHMGRGMDRLLKLGRDSGLSLDIQNDVGWSPLTFACENHVAEAVEKFLAGGADPNLAENDGWAPLHFAAFHGDSASVEILLKYNADATVLNRAGLMPFELAMDKGHTSEAHVLARRAYDLASNANDVRRMIRVIKGLPDEVQVNRFSNSQTPLSLAVKLRDLESVSTLLELGADARISDLSTGDSPLHIAVQHGDADIIRVILSSSTALRAAGHETKAVDVSRVNNVGVSPIGLAEALYKENGEQWRHILVAIQQFAGLPTLDEQEAERLKAAAKAEEEEKAKIKAKARSFLSA